MFLLPKKKKQQAPLQPTTQPPAGAAPVQKPLPPQSKTGVPAPVTQRPTPPQHPAPTTQPQNPTQSRERFAAGMVTLQDVVAPAVVDVDFDHVKINDMYYRTLFVTGYPRFVSANWLHPVVSFDHSLFIAMFIYPERSKEILEDRKSTRLNSSHSQISYAAFCLK